MKKIAIVVQRCHPSVVGGSEALAWQYANLLKDNFEVEVLTTTALSTSDWANVLPSGKDVRDGIVVRRFAVSLGRTSYWGRLHERLLTDFRKLHSSEVEPGDGPRFLPWTLTLQEEFVRTQGPYSQSLLAFLNQRWSDYQSIIFVTYLYPTTWFGLVQVPRHFALFVPTLHDEEPAYLSLYKHAAHRAKSIIWLTHSEQRLGERLWGEIPGDVVGMNIDIKRRPAPESGSPYVLYCGRIDPNKGCYDLLDFFARFKEQHPSKLRLVLAGKDDIAIPSHPDIDFRGFVSSEEKFSLMAGATAFAMPSARESFSIVTLEAMAQGTPVLASDKSAVIADHVRNSDGGYVYKDYEDFAMKLSKLLSDTRTARELGARGSEYVAARYEVSRVQSDLIKVVEDHLHVRPHSGGAESFTIFRRPNKA